MTLRYLLLSILLLPVVVAAQSSPSLTLLPQFDSQERPFFGFRVAAADFDGDGLDEIVVSSVEADGPTGRIFEGRVSVFSGTDGSLVRELVSPQGNPNSFFGQAICVVGDLDGDEVEDLLVSASGENNANTSEQGALYVFSGADGSVIDRIPVIGTGFIFASRLLALSDVTGDGVPDFAASNPSTEDGEVYIFSGADRSLVRTISPGDALNVRSFGSSLSTTSDMDGDGLDDIAIGATGGATRVVVYSSGSGTQLLNISSPQPPSTATDGFGAQSARLPDVDGDGVDDIVIGAPFTEAPGESVRVGIGYLYSGLDGTLIQTFIPPFRFNNSPQSLAVQPISDMDGDGADDILIAWWVVGRAVVFSSLTGEVLVELQNAVSGTSSSYGRGLGLASLGSEPALIVGDPGVQPADPAGVEGAVYVYEMDLMRTIVPAEPSAAEAGWAVSASPNPTSGPLALALTLPSAQRVRVDVIDVLGRRVASREIQGRTGASRHDIGLADVAPGVYVVRVQGDSGTASVRVTVSR